MLIFNFHFVGFSFHSCSIMIVNNQNVFMNGVKEDGELGEGFLSFVYVVQIHIVIQNTSLTYHIHIHT
jgi:hypothetical protein